LNSRSAREPSRSTGSYSPLIRDRERPLSVSRIVYTHRGSLITRHAVTTVLSRSYFSRSSVNDRARSPPNNLQLSAAPATAVESASAHARKSTAPIVCEMVPSVIEAVVPPVYDNIGVIIGTEAPVRFATVKIVAVIRTIIRGVIGGAISGYI